MRMKVLSAVLLALPLPAATLAYVRAHVCFRATDVPSLAAGNCDGLECREQGTKADAPERKDKSDVPPTDPARLLVFKVEGLTCPAVKGIGCGHMLQGVLASLDKIDGVGASSANYTGTLIRISVTSATDRDKVAEAARRVLAVEHRNAVALAGDEFKHALDREEWREAGRIGELSSIEFHTLALHRVKTFAKAEKLDKKATEKLVEIAEQHWERIGKEAKNDGATQPEDLGKRIKASLPVFLERAKGVLTAEQVERFKQTLTGPCRDDDCPEAPPAPARGSKAR
jgi:hypothetical protein